MRSEIEYLHIKAHEACTRNWETLSKSKICACFHCLKTFSFSEIDDWCDAEPSTAFCPQCKVDSVIGSASGYPITEHFLRKMHHYWFEDRVPENEVQKKRKHHDEL